MTGGHCPSPVASRLLPVSCFSCLVAIDPLDRLLAPGELARIVEPWGWEVSLDEGASREHGHERGTVHLIARRPR